MANYYVRSAASGAGTGANWANAFTTLVAACTAAAAGDSIYVSEDHAETQAATMTIVFPGTPASPNRVLCVNHAGSVPPVSADLATTATVTTTGSNNMILSGCAFVQGITFNATTSGGGSITFGGAVQSDLYFKNSQIAHLNSAGGQVVLGSGNNAIGTRLTWDNTTYKVAAANATLYPTAQVEFIWKNTPSAIAGSTFPTSLFGIPGGQAAGTFLFDGVDLSALSGKTIVPGEAKGCDFYFKDCKLPASVTTSVTPTSVSSKVFVIRSASGATAYTLEKHDLRGDQTTETTVIRTGGKTINGQGVSAKIIGTANATSTAPFEMTPMVAGNAASGSKTVTVYGVWSGGAVPNNDQVWMEVGYLGDSGSPLASFNSGTKADVLATATAQPTDTSTWGGGTTKFKMTATVSTQLAGEIYIVVKCATTNTVYIDPLPVIS